MIGNYLRSKWSKGLSGNRADVTTKDIRLLSCFGDSTGISVCPGLRPSEKKRGKFICGECGCGDKSDTILNTNDGEYGKLDHPYVVCPRKMPGFSNYETDKKDERKVLIEVSIGADILRNKELVNPTPPEVPVEPEAPTEKKGCSKCEAARKAREAAGEKTTGGGSCPKCEERRKRLEEKRAATEAKGEVFEDNGVSQVDRHRPKDQDDIIARARRIVEERRKKNQGM